ncbi:MAG TPA: OmpA family protein [Humisphaera sp.]|nr:OmpA family protein [Humisphaera sp.]
MKGLCMIRAWNGILLVALALGVTGCQNKLYEDNQALREQNKELQSQLDSKNSAPPQVVQTAPPQQAAVPVSQPMANDQAPPPKQAAQPKPDLGNLETTVDAKAGTTTVSLPGDLFFDPGQITIKDPAKQSLDKVAAALKKEYAGKQVRIEGYTDSDPIVHSKWKSNQELSEKRAGAVRDYLVSKGVATSRIKVVGMGEAHPRSTTNKSLNRRVEVVVLTR